MPSQLLGRWVADAPQYADRILDVRRDLIAFGTGPYSQDFYAVVGVETLPEEDGWTTYRVSVREDDSELSDLQLAYRDGSPRELRFRNHQEIWRPEGSLPAAPETAPAKKTYRLDGWMVRERSDG